MTRSSLSVSSLGASLVLAVGLAGVPVSGAVAAVGTDVAVAVSAAPSTVTIGDAVTVTATVTNVGSTSVTTPQVRVDTDNGSVLSGSVPGGSCSAGWALSCTLPNMAAGSSVAVTATVRPDYQGPATFTAEVWLDAEFDENSSNDRASSVVTVVGVVPVVSLSASTGTVTYGKPVSLTASVSARGVAVRDVGLVLYRRTASQPSPVVVDYEWSDAAGVARFTDDPREQAEYFAVSDTTDDLAPGSSPTVIVRVGVSVTTTVSPVAIPPGGRLSLTARVQPAVPGSTVTVQERYGSGPWRTVATPVQGPDGRVTVTLGRRSQVGTYALRVVRGPDARFAEGSGETTTVVTVTGTGKAATWRPMTGTKRRPGHWGTCTIGYKVNRRHMPAHGMSDLREAMRRVTQVSGIKFRYAGRSKAVPHYAYAGAGVNKFLVAWAGYRESKGLLPPGVGGVGGTSWTSGGRILTGYLAINTAYSRTADPGFGDGSPHGMVLMHELGHVVGLDHANDVHQVMHPSASLRASVWGAADIKGLRALGRAGGCRR
jgi:hypothetical protein